MNLSVVIGTCDKYSSLWKPFQITFDRYWKFDTKNIFVGETEIVPQYTNTKFETSLQGKGGWANRIRAALETVDTDYVFFILDDYFFDYHYTEKQMKTWLNDMKAYNMNRLQIAISGHQLYKSIEGVPYDQIVPESDYLISCQPSIWKKTFLSEMLNPSYSPWQFEIHGSELLKNKELNTYIDRTVGHVYFNAVRQGFQKSPGWEAFRIKEGLDDFDETPVIYS